MTVLAIAPEKRRALIGRWRADGWSWARIGAALGIDARRAENASANGLARDREYKYQQRRLAGRRVSRCSRCGELGHNRRVCS